MGPVKNDWDLKAMLRSEQTSKEKSLSKLDQFKQSWEIKVENSGAWLSGKTHYHTGSFITKFQIDQIIACSTLKIFNFDSKLLEIPFFYKAHKVEIFLEQSEFGFLSPSKICENLNFSTEIKIFTNFAGW